MEKRFVATLSRSQGRSGWSVIFRHPVRIDPNTGKSGLRVRQGLRTGEEAEANQIKDELNQLLGDEAFWNAAARQDAEGRFHRRAVEIFFHEMVPEERDFAAVREGLIPLPSSTNSDYRRVLLLGTTGAGKTTLLRQLLGTDPETERFPSTSTAKTTVHETEVVVTDGPYRAAATFFPVEEVREHLNECISEAVLAAHRGAGDSDVLRRLLVHVNQRFRFNYVLGNGPGLADSALDDEDEYEAAPRELDNDESIDLAATNELLERAVGAVREMARRQNVALRDELGAEEKDQRVVDELFEEELDRRLRGSESFNRLSDELLDELELRFSMLDQGNLTKNKQGWPQSWYWECADRADFLKMVTRFSSNHAPRFGRLLTPLVNGIRVSGPFAPTWSGAAQPKLVLLDGEGIGHTPKSLAAISTAVTRRIDLVDAVVLVDSATQPMQAAPITAMKELISSGNAKKLIVLFSQFDRVKGDNLQNAAEKERHVLESAENVLAAVGQELGYFAERALRGRLEDACYFAGNLNEPLSEARKSHKRTISQLQAMLGAIDSIVERPEPIEARPVYDRLRLVLAVKKAAEGFRDTWWPMLGLPSTAVGGKQHWKRIWALSRRLATPGWADEYGDLKPVADLKKHLQGRLYVQLQNPIRWEPSEPATEEKKQQVFDRLANALSAKTLELAARRIRAERLVEWQSAYGQAGRGASYARAQIIGNQIYSRAAPIPDDTPFPDGNAFLHEVVSLVDEACSAAGATLLN